MRLFISLVAMVGTICFSASALSAEQPWRKFVKVAPDRELWVDYMPAKAGKPTVVLLNGLTYSTFQWGRFAETLNEKGYGVVRYDMFGMGRTLLKYAPILARIELKDQISDLRSLLNKLNISKANLVGLSYGGGIAVAFGAAHPNMVNKLILMAPFTEPVEAQDLWIKDQIWATRKLQPWNMATDDELYDFFLKQIVYSTYPAVEPIILENPFKLEAVFRLVQGVRKWNAFDEAKKLPAGSVHMMIAGEDQYIPSAILEKFWKVVPAASRASYFVIQDTEHKIPEDIPSYSARWVAEIVNGNPAITGGAKFEGRSSSNTVRGPNGTRIELP